MKKGMGGWGWENGELVDGMGEWGLGVWDGPMGIVG